MPILKELAPDLACKVLILYGLLGEIVGPSISRFFYRFTNLMIAG
jgi:hypothetical protein